MGQRILYVPLSVQAAATVVALQALANAQSLSLAVLDHRVTDEDLASQTSDLVVIKQIELGRFTPANYPLCALIPEGSEAFVQDVVNRHPSHPRSWCLIHGSEGIATAIWLSESGAPVILASEFEHNGQRLALGPQHHFADAASELEMYRGLQCRSGIGFDITSQTEANSPNLSTDAEHWHDLSGRAEHIIVGPYFYIPFGNWTVDIDFDVDVDEGHVRLFFEWGSPSGHRNNFESVLKESGRYAVSLETDFARPDAAHCLIATNASHLQGRLRLRKCVITRLDAPKNLPLPNWA